MKKLTAILAACSLVALIITYYYTSAQQTVKLEHGSFFTFARNDIDLKYGGNGKPGWVRASDVDNDGDLDIVAGGGYALFVYENDGHAEGWRRYGTLDATHAMGANGGVLYDVDGDAYPDVISAQYRGDLGWWRNPGDGLKNETWMFHKITENIHGYLHDLILADLDQDGRAEEFVANLNSGKYWNTDIEVLWLRPGADVNQPWTSHIIEPGRSEGPAHGHAGMDVGDIDGDGDADLAFSNGWYEAPGDPAGSWTWHPVTDIYGITNTVLRDLDDDGDLDMVVSGGHHGQGVYWLENTGGLTARSWKQHAISAVVGDITLRHRYKDEEFEHIHHPECLAVQDLDGDGDQDVITCDLFFGEDPGEPDWSEEAHNVYVFENLGSGASWRKNHVVSNAFPSHLLQVVDINKDGLMDIISEATGYSVVSYYENTTQNSASPPTVSAAGGHK